MEEIGILEREKIIRRENNMNKRMRGEEKRMAGLSAEKMGLISILLEKGRPFSRENESVFSTIREGQDSRGDERGEEQNTEKETEVNRRPMEKWFNPARGEHSRDVCMTASDATTITP